MTTKILHVCLLDKFIPPFINFVEKHFGLHEHEFRVFRVADKYQLKERECVRLYQRRGLAGIYAYLSLMSAMIRAEKIILHGLFDMRVIILLFFQPWLLKKCYWIIWGGDLYIHESEIKDWHWYKNEFFRKFLIRRFGHLITLFKGEYDLAVKWYGAKGQHHKCFTYPSNIYKKSKLKYKTGETINIQVGNSATHTNEHFKVLERLSLYKDQDIKIFVPLSYGNDEYAKKVVELGKSIFGYKFIPILDFMAYDEYLNFLEKIDIAIFNNSRQQAMGNMIALLGLGKKVYLRSTVSSWISLRQYGLQVFDIEKFDISILSRGAAEQNKNIISECFSESRLSGQLKMVFELDSITS